ncbi:MAG: ABC-type amino acid transport substrate-binding protein [Planctomycetota bacterium]
MVRVGEGEPTALADLGGRAVSARAGTTSELAPANSLPAAVIAVPSPKGDGALQRLESKELDAAVMNGPDAIEFAAGRPGDLQVLPSALASKAYAVAIHPDYPSLKASINAALDALRTSGEL